ncbi:hypothetical protein ACI789_21355 [Geodermatophilus sp. SYSU D00965]
MSVIGVVVAVVLLLALVVWARLPEPDRRRRGAGYVDPAQYDTRLAPPSTSTAAGSAWGGGGAWGGGSGGC